MKYVTITFLAVCLVFLGAGSASADNNQTDDYRITGPFIFRNLSLFFIHGEDNIRDENTLTLEEALKNKSVIVYETGNVGELEIENKSSWPVFINSGDIVKGGRQDRIIRYDVVIPPGSGKEKLPSFCVEQGRWSQRGGEEAAQFEISDKFAASKEIKLSAKSAESQQRVWSEVDLLQDRLSGAANISVREGLSTSSLQLTLEHEAVDRLARPFVDFFAKQAGRHKDILGFAFAINGKINSADIYRSRELFRKLWPKMIEAASVEALANLKDGEEYSEVSIDSIISWLKTSDDLKSETKIINEATKMNIKEGESDIIFETVGKENNILIHKNIIRR